MIYTRLQEDYKVLSRTLTRKSTINPKNGLHPLFIRRRRNPQNSSRSGTESVLTQLSDNRPRSTQVCSRPRKVLQHCKTYWKCRSTDRLIGLSTDQLVSLLSVNFDRPGSRPIQALCMSIDRPVDWSPVIELKKPYLLFLPSLCTSLLGDDWNFRIGLSKGKLIWEN